MHFVPSGSTIVLVYDCLGASTALQPATWHQSCRQLFARSYSSILTNWTLPLHWLLCEASITVTFPHSLRTSCHDRVNVSIIIYHYHHHHHHHHHNSSQSFTRIKCTPLLPFPVPSILPLPSSHVSRPSSFSRSPLLMIIRGTTSENFFENTGVRSYSCQISRMRTG